MPVKLSNIYAPTWRRIATNRRFRIKGIRKFELQFSRISLRRLAPAGWNFGVARGCFRSSTEFIAAPRATIFPLEGGPPASACDAEGPRRPWADPAPTAGRGASRRHFRVAACSSGTRSAPSAREAVEGPARPAAECRVEDATLGAAVSVALAFVSLRVAMVAHGRIEIAALQRE